MYKDFPFTIDDIAINLLGLRTRNGLPSTTSNSYRVLCPFCKSPNPHYTLDIVRGKNFWSCQACNTTGGMLDLYKKVKYGEYSAMSNTEVYKEIMEALNKEDYAPVYQKAEFKPVVSADTSDDKQIHRVYVRMFKMPCFHLTDEHKNDLLKRGLTHAQIINNGYRSSPDPVYAYEIARILIEEGYDLSGIPGFYQDTGKMYEELRKKGHLGTIPGYKAGEKNWLFKPYPSGYYIPVRNLKGLIASVQIRTKNPAAKYVFLSSSNLEQGAKANSCAHFVGNFADVPERVFVTEGPLKADIAHAFTGFPYFALPGITTYKAMEKAVDQLRRLGVKEIIGMYDMDQFSNMNVQKAIKELNKIVEKSGLICSSRQWDKKYKGIDDFMFHKVQERKESELQAMLTTKLKTGGYVQ